MQQDSHLEREEDAPNFVVATQFGSLDKFLF